MPDSESTAPFTITVFAGARCDPDHRFIEVATEVGREIATRAWRLVYGGGDHGLMGAMATSALANGAHVLAVVPNHIVTSESVIFPEQVEVIRTDSTRERKQVMDDVSDAFLALPGGIGTLEELAEVMTLRQLGVHARPIVVLDTDGFWAPLRQQFLLMHEASVVDPPLLDYVEFHAEVHDAVTSLVNWTSVPAAGTGAESSTRR